MRGEILRKPIAITDVETTGYDPMTQEIIEIGLVLVNQETLEIINTLDVKVRPEHLETATEDALKFNGYNPADWRNALTLKEAINLYAEKTKGAIFCAHNVTFDWSFINEAFKKTGVKDQMDYHRLDLLTMIWLKYRNSGLQKFRLNEAAKFLGIAEESKPHRAINGAILAYKIYKQIVS